jgi:hypothetical protein
MRDDYKEQQSILMPFLVKKNTKKSSYYQADMNFNESKKQLS